MGIKLSALNIKSVNVDKDKFSAVTDAGCIVNVTAVSARTLEIWVDFDGKGNRNESFSIDKMPENNMVVSNVDKGSYYLVSAGEAAIRLYKNNIKIEYVTKDDTKVICHGREIGKDDDGSVYMYNKISADEHFYGLGEDNDGYLGSLDRRGHTRDMFTCQRINVGKVTADIPISFYMSTGEGSPYGIFTDNSYPMYYDMGKENPDECYQKALGGDMIFYYFRGENFTDILNEYTDLTGKPPMPPLWTQGYIQCRCSYWSWEQIDGIVKGLKDRNIPLDCIVFDYDWAEYFNNYKWNKRWNGQSPEKIAEYRKQGIHFMASNSGPMLKKDSDTYPSALEKGLLARDTDGNTITCCHYGGDLLDFSHPDMKEWLRPQLERILDDGVESWWLDLTEPEGDPENTVYYGGERNKIHNIFSLLNTKMYNEITKNHCPEMRPFILTRTGTAGIQKYCTSIWSGDVYSDYETFTAHIPEAINTGMSGVPMWTSDAGGFISSTNNAVENRNVYKNDVSRHGNLYERWVQFACFCPVMRVHHAGESLPYAFGDLISDSVAHYIRLRYRLLPYIYSYAYKSHLTGEPVMRPLVYNYINDPKVYDLTDEYLFGNEMLVAPVHNEEQTEREVYFPEGKWYDYDYGYVYEGGRSYKIYAPQNRIPVFARAGAIIPMSEQIYNTSELDTKTIAAEIYPEGKSSFTLYTDDGKTVDYEKGIYTLTEITCDDTKGVKTVIRISQSNDNFLAEKMYIKVHVTSMVKNVTVNGGETERTWHLHCMRKDNIWCHEEFSRILYISAVLGKGDNEIVIEYEENSVLPISVRSESDENISGQSPFILPAASVPCHIAFENFDRGGEGVAYHKETPDNTEGLYRNDAVGIESCDDVGCGFCVKGLTANEWIEYTVNVLEEGSYRFRLRVSAENDSVLSVFTDEAEIVSELDVSGSAWHDACSEAVSLKTGEQTIRFFLKSGKVRGNYFEIEKV